MVQLKVKNRCIGYWRRRAGLRAAVAAADCGAQVILVSKRKVGIAGATAFLLLKWQDIMLVISAFPVIPSLIMKIL